MALTKEERLGKVWDRATSRFDRAYGPQQQIRLASLEDRRFAFVDGAQWEGGLGAQFNNRPRFVVNKTQKAVRRIVSEYRANAMTVNFRSSDDGSRQDDLDALRIVYRSDEQYSGAQDVYVSAFEEAVAGGVGAWRLTNDYDHRAEVDLDDDTPQRILFEPINDADISVFFDPDSRKLDKSDAKWCVVLNPISWDTYTDEYLSSAEVKIEERPSSFKMVRSLKQFDWFTNDAVYIGEYYEVEQKVEQYSVWLEPNSKLEQKVYAGLDAESREDAAEQEAHWKSIGYAKVRTGKRNRKRVRKYFLDGSGVLKDCGYIAGSEIPIVVVFGIRQIIDGIERFQGAVRLAKDSQRLYNMQISTLADITAFTPREKPIFTPEQMAGHELTWAGDLVANNPYLLINPITGADGSSTVSGPVGQIKQPDVPPALAGLVQITAADMLDVTGGDLAADQVNSNTSDALVSRVQAHQDMQVYIFIDNMARALERCGKVYMSMAADVYVEENRPFAAIGEDNTSETTKINVPSLNADGEPIITRAFTPGLDVFVDVGPAFNSRKDSTVNTLIKLLPAVVDPQMAQLVMNTLIQNLDGEGMQDLSAYSRKQLVQAGVVKPTDEEAQELEEAQQEAANAPPDAATVALLAQARESDANASKSQASAVQSLSTAELNQAKAAQAVSTTNASQLATIIQMLQGMQGNVQNTAEQISASQPQHPLDGKVNAAIASGNAAPSPGINPLHGVQQVQPDPTAQQLTSGNGAPPPQAPIHASNRPAVGK
ncbi:portal protein [Paraburkholderia sp. BL9I2N2]|uniref:portal protein n=1 Tax=Paraburkholderia sp. BL9I2N2 TaxID=1938809 RepID=UPI00104EDDA9|nr:portal protein [Paraburkholderia sp. BL9I2N2]TCK87363.1 phage P22-like portal protein [Paraburkholderia sp. BL9I2N2]